MNRIHVVLSCRPSDWRPSIDLTTFKSTLPPHEESEERTVPDEVFLSALREQPRRGSRSEQADKRSGTRIVVLLPLNQRQIARFAAALRVDDPQAFIAELGRQDAWSFARRPLDLSELVLTWMTHGRLGTRAEQHEANAAARLKDDRSDRDALTDERLREGAARLALALALVRLRTIRAPELTVDVEYARGVLDSGVVLTDWSEHERQVLLRRALFDPATYGRVRFHHRSVQEYLAAYRLKTLREKGMPVSALFRLLFAERHGVRVVVPSLRPIAAWLALWERHVLRELITREPETLLAMGDPETLSLDVRRDVLRAFTAAYGVGRWRGIRVPLDEVRRLAHPELAGVIRELWGTGPSNDDVRELLLELIEQGKVERCADFAETAARDTALPDHHRLIAVRAIIACGRLEAAAALARSMIADRATWNDELTANLVDDLSPRFVSPVEVVDLMRASTSSRTKVTYSLAMSRIATAMEPQSADSTTFRERLSDLLLSSRVEDNSGFRFDGPYDHAAPALAEVCLRQLDTSAVPADSNLMKSSVIASRFGGHESAREDAVRRLRTRLRADDILREQAFWSELALVEGVLPSATEPWLRLRRTQHDGVIDEFEERDQPWLQRALLDKSMPAARPIALHGLLHFWVRRGRDGTEARALCDLVREEPGFAAIVEDWVSPRPPKPEIEEMEREHEKYRAEAAEREQRRLDDWQAWRTRVVENPISAFAPEQSLSTIANLYQWLESQASGGGYTAWDEAALIAAFGPEVATRAKDALRQLWRRQSVVLWSARASAARNTTQGTWIYGLNGMAVEAQSRNNWAARLSTDEAKRATAYATIELNGLPSWLADLVAAHPTAVEEVLGGELADQLGLVLAEQHLPLLQAVAYADSDLQRLLAPRVVRAIRSWGAVPTGPADHAMRHLENAFKIIESAAVQTEDLIDGCESRYLAEPTGPLGITWLRALFMFAPKRAVAVLESTLSALVTTEREAYTTKVLAAVFGSHSGFVLGVQNTTERAHILARLVRVAYEFVRPSDDQQHEGVYSPNTRDEAERARAFLLSALLDTDGAEAQRIVLELAGDPMFAESSDRLRLLARERAAKDAEVLFTAADVLELERRYEIPPSDRDGLFDVMMDRLDDLGRDITHHDFTDRRMMCAVDDETEMQRTLALRLDKARASAYVVTRESEVADSKRTDIRLAAVSGDQKATIEVKIADGRWSVTQLEAALRDQLVGRYLRHENARCGCLLLTFHGTKSYWEHPQTSARLSFLELVDHLSAVAEAIEIVMARSVRLAVRGLDLRDPIVS